MHITCTAITMLLNLLLEPVVARPARLQWAMPEQVGITIMGCDVIRYCGSGYPVVSLAHTAQGMLL